VPRAPANAPREAEHGRNGAGGLGGALEPPPTSRSIMASIVRPAACCCWPASSCVVPIRRHPAKVTTRCRGRASWSPLRRHAQRAQSEGQYAGVRRGRQGECDSSPPHRCQAGMPTGHARVYTTVDKSLADVKDRFAFYESSCRRQPRSTRTPSDPSPRSPRRRLMTDLARAPSTVRLVATNGRRHRGACDVAGGRRRHGRASRCLNWPTSMRRLVQVGRDAAANAASPGLRCRVHAGRGGLLLRQSPAARPIATSWWSSCPRTPR